MRAGAGARGARPLTPACALPVYWKLTSST